MEKVKEMDQKQRVTEKQHPAAKKEEGALPRVAVKSSGMTPC